MDDEEVEPPVAVVVEEGRAGAPAGTRDTGCRGDVNEMSVAIVLQQDIAAVGRHVEIGVPVVVEIAGRDAHPVSAHAGAAPVGDVLERAVAAIAVQAAARAGRVVGEAAALDQIQIEEAVVVHVEQRRAAAHDLGQKVFRVVAGPMDEIDSSPAPDFLEPRR